VNDTTGECRDPAQETRQLIERILEAYPRRAPASQEELETQLLLKSAFEAMGIETRLEPFRFNAHLYANLALHFGTGLVGTLLAGRRPGLSAALSSLAAGSYLADSTRKAYVLRRLLPWKTSHNLLATLKARGTPELRIVVIGHADAAYTGFLFNPEVIKRFTPHDMPESMAWLGRSLAIATWSQFASAGFALLRATLPRGSALWPVSLALGLPAAIAFAANLEVVLRDEIVPGANDNLSGAAATVELARRLGPRKPDSVELVFVVTGCEEAGTGGAAALARAHRKDWETTKTVVVALDSLSNGDLKFFEEGEILPVPTPRWLADLATRTAAQTPELGGVAPFQIPSGATDVLPFRAQGYDGISLGCVDPEFGCPRHYHHPSDTLENLDIGQLMRSIDFSERLIEAIWRTRLQQDR